MKKIRLIFPSLLFVVLLTGCSAKNSANKASNVSSSSSSTVVSSTSSSSTSASSSSTPESSPVVDFDQLNTTSKNKLYAAWLQNTQGQFVIYNVDAITTYIVNEGQNGTKMYENGKKVGNAWAGYSLAREENSAKFVIVGDSISLFVPNKEKNNIDGNWSDLNWSLQEKLTKSELVQKYYQESLTNQQIVLTEQSAPN